MQYSPSSRQLPSTRSISAALASARDSALSTIYSLFSSTIKKWSDAGFTFLASTGFVLATIRLLLLPLFFSIRKHLIDNFFLCIRPVTCQLYTDTQRHGKLVVVNIP